MKRLHAVIEGPGRRHDGASRFCVDGHWEQAVAHAVEWLREDMDLLGTDEKVNITVSLRMESAKSCCLCHPEEQDREPPPEAKQMAERTRSVWVVRFGSHHPDEVDSLWGTREKALERAEAMNREYDTEQWEVIEWEIE